MFQASQEVGRFSEQNSAFTRRLASLGFPTSHVTTSIVKLSLAREEELLKGFSASERKLLLNFLSRMHAQVIDAGVWSNAAAIVLRLARQLPVIRKS